ncbi:MAG: D-alanine--D-alanine ligase [Bacteroidia bacterium]|nr:D-alanine--D-alanine ligase [Bacteroidia bacterium]
MYQKLRVGIIFGGSSREREVSFAGGRTVYDNLDKSLFEAVPLFADSFGNIVELDWQYVYKGSIRDFYPPVDKLPETKHGFQIYAESIESTESEKLELVSTLGKVLNSDDLKSKIDFAFLALHGSMGEDGSIQGMLEWLQIPYSGSGIFGSAVGINKKFQKALLADNPEFESQSFISVSREIYLSETSYRKIFFLNAKNTIGFPLVVKSAVQGSSIGVTVVHEADEKIFEQAIFKSLFIQYIKADEWQSLTYEGKIEKLRSLVDIREGIGMPLFANGEIIYHPDNLFDLLDSLTSDGKNTVELQSLHSENEVLVEPFIEGREFSCIVVKDDAGQVIALPPTEIKKGKEVFDYRSKYLPGLSRKITPISVTPAVLELIRSKCEALYSYLNFNVYARIDGFITNEGKILLNDPNTTSGMMPSSFFFHQAAEIGLNPSEFLTFIIRNSLSERIHTNTINAKWIKFLSELDLAIEDTKKAGKTKKERIAVIMGGYSFERHISVESGRNIYEKLASSETYEPVPVFLSGSSDDIRLWLLPVSMMLKDNADDIKEKVENYQPNPELEKIKALCEGITRKYVKGKLVFTPEQLSFNGVRLLADGVFIALHGRPGEDGAIQKHLEKAGLYYNGSGIPSSQITINKFTTNELLGNNGFSVADHLMVDKAKWALDRARIELYIENNIGFPLIAKPHDDGCSSAVKKIKNTEQLRAFADQMFRNEKPLVEPSKTILGLNEKEEFPLKECFLVEKFVGRKSETHFLETTTGMLTRYENGELKYEIFEPSETLAEGDILSLEEKFLAGQGQNITPARFSKNQILQKSVSEKVRVILEKAARLLNIEGYCRIDAFVRIFEDSEIEVVFIEVNSLPGMTPATCIYHQAAINNYKPFDFIDKILKFGKERAQNQTTLNG